MIDWSKDAVLLKPGDKIPFVYMDELYGRAEFVFVPIINKQAIMRGVYILRGSQLTPVGHARRYKVSFFGGSEQGFALVNERQRLGKMGVWRYHSCKACGFTMSVYVEDGMSEIEYRASSISADFIFR